MVEQRLNGHRCCIFLRVTREGFTVLATDAGNMNAGPVGESGGHFIARMLDAKPENIKANADIANACRRKCANFHK